MIAIGGIGGSGLVGVVVELGKSLGLLSDLARDKSDVGGQMAARVLTSVIGPPPGPRPMRPAAKSA